MSDTPNSPAPAPRGGTPHASAHLPHAHHRARLPAHVTLEQIAQLRQAAYLLPQVVKPADFIPEHTPGFERYLDGQGYVQLQKTVAGQRPSRWIAPEHVDAALAHVAAIGTGPGARPLMLQRGATLEGLGITRHAGHWKRRVRQPLKLSDPAWQIAVAFEVDAPDEAIWRFYRDGDDAALRAALGPDPQWPDAPALTAHLEGLLARSDAFQPQHIAALLPRLEAECATPQPLAELMAACTRAQDRWEHQMTERLTLEGLNSELAFQGYPDSFPKARLANRQVHLYVGAPNSGKTYAAFERLAQAEKGAYLAPLRLLALEGRDRLAARGVPCSLLTGEENVPAAGARVVSSTIEMVGTNAPVDVAVIDEAQMIFDGSRGWAWTQAIVAVPAKELIIICSAYAVPAIENLLGLCGERATIRHFERKQQVQLLPGPVPLHALQKGDAVVAFSRRDVLTLRDAISANGHPVSVIYGALPPEVRRGEAERFATGASHILVATDAIGMGLNLPIRRVLFSTLTKFDGETDRHLDESETHQIAGRAGRFGLHEEGFAGVLKEAEPTAGRILKELLGRHPKAPRHFKAPVAPNGWHVDTISARLDKQRLREVLGVFMEQLKLDDAHFAVAELGPMLELAEQIDRVALNLPLKQRFTYAQAPVDSRTVQLVEAFLGWVQEHAQHGAVREPDFLHDVDGHSRLERQEQTLRACTLWLWLDLRFPGVFGHVDAVQSLRAELNAGIERQLKGQRPLARARGGARGPKPAWKH